ncbi:MAG TPA: pitrilysin family protein [Methylomirabilota bacterium]|jgi:zinc protease
MRPRRLPALLVVLALLLAPPAGAAKPIAHREVLANGIVLLVAERPAIPIVVVRAFAHAGAVLDPPDRAGLANLTGALLTRGTAKHSGPELDSAIEFVGGSLSAGAARDGLSASLSVLKKDVGLGLDLMAEVLLTPTFPEDELKRKAAQIQAAIKRSEEDPGIVAGRALAKLVFPSHPYGVPVEGTVESVGKLTRDDVVRFHRAYVRPDTTIIAVAGAVTVDEARREIVARFGGWKAPSEPPPTVSSVTPGAAPQTQVIEKELTQATILLGRQAIRQTDPDYFPLTVGSYVLGGGSASRLYARVREEGGLAYAVYSYANPARYGASFVVSAQTRTAEVPKVVEIMREELARMTREPVTERELKLAKDYLIGSFPLRLDTTSKVADFIVAIEEQGLGLDYADRYKERVAKVTAADVQRVAAKYLAPDTFNRVIVGAPKP